MQRTISLRPLTALLLVTGLSALVFGAAAPETTSERTADEEAVHAAVEDYVLAFYRVEPERIERSVAPEMKKMGYWRAEPEAEYQGPLHMSFDQALDLAGRWNVDDKRGTDLTYSIELYEVADKTACAKLTADWGIDYMQLAKDAEGDWSIHHVLWQSHP